MADNSIVQTIKDAEIDARSLSEFIYKPANFTVYRRLAPAIHTLDYYLNKLDIISDDLEDRVKDVLSSMGFIIKGSFADGATLSTYNDVLVDSSGVLYRWGGNLPKTVPAGGTPANTGGFADNAWVAISNADMTGIASGKALNGSGAVLVDGAAIYIDSYHKLSSIPPSGLKVGQVAKVRGTDFAWSGSEWKPVGRIYVNSWGARGDAPQRLNEINATNSKQAFIDAASYALEHGHSHVFAEAGIYYTPDLTCDDMQEVYIVGDGVEFTCTNNFQTQQGHARVLALTEQEYTNGVGWNSRNNSNTRGRLAIVFDDGSWSHFGVLPNLFKKYGVTYGIAWHTAGGQDVWMKEVYRHGIELLAHTPDNTTCTSLTDDQLAQRAEADLAAIEAITGRRDNVHFVYPQHARDSRTDNILSQYFVTGRGIESPYSKANNQAGSWVCSSMSIETNSMDRVYAAIKNAADTNTNLVLYGHGYEFEKASIIEGILKYALGLGVNIAPPSQVKIAPVTHFKRYFKDPTEWSLDSNSEWSESVKSSLGARSIKASSTVTTYANFTFKTTKFLQTRSNKAYSHYKLSFLYKSSSDIISSAGFGFGIQYIYRTIGSNGIGVGGAGHHTTGISSLPAANFDNKVEMDVYIPNSIADFQIGFSGLNIKAPFEIYFDDIRFTKVSEVDTALIKAKVGKSVKDVVVGNTAVNLLSTRVEHDVALDGVVSLSHINADKGTFKITSSDDSDNDKDIYILATPKFIYSNYTGI